MTKRSDDIRRTRGRADGVQLGWVCCAKLVKALSAATLFAVALSGQTDDTTC